MKFRTQYQAFKKRRDPGGRGKPGRTKQSFKDECDINNIMKRFEKTGALPDMIKTQPQYGDFSEVPEYQEACNIVMHADTQFKALSAKVRDRFSNDPEKFLAFATDPRNAKEMVTLGLAIKRAPTADEIARAPRQKKAPKPETPPKEANEK